MSITAEQTLRYATRRILRTAASARPKKTRPMKKSPRNTRGLLREDPLRALVATLRAGRLARHDGRQHIVLHGLLGDDDLGDVVAAGDVVHDRQQHLFHDG